jgi:hypothetical protein
MATRPIQGTFQTADGEPVESGSVKAYPVDALPTEGGLLTPTNQVFPIAAGIIEDQDAVDPDDRPEIVTNARYRFKVIYGSSQATAIEFTADVPDGGTPISVADLYAAGITELDPSKVPVYQDDEMIAKLTSGDALEGQVATADGDGGWTYETPATAPVTSVAGRTGAVTLSTADISGLAAAISTAVDAVIDSAPGTLDTLNELAAALGDDANFASTVSAAIAAKVSDTAYDATSWNGVTTVAPSKNAVRDQLETLLASITAAAANAAKCEIGVAVSDETTAIATGTAKVTFRMPYAMTVTSVRASLTTASSSGDPVIDINESGTTILSTKLSIDSGETTSLTATTPAVISDAVLADDAVITIDIDTAGTGAAGLKVWLIGTRI